MRQKLFECALNSFSFGRVPFVEYHFNRQMFSIAKRWCNKKEKNKTSKEHSVDGYILACTYIISPLSIFAQTYRRTQNLSHCDALLLGYHNIVEVPSFLVFVFIFELHLCLCLYFSCLSSLGGRLPQSNHMYIRTTSLCTQARTQTHTHSDNTITDHTD